MRNLTWPQIIGLSLLVTILIAVGLSWLGSRFDQQSREICSYPYLDCPIEIASSDFDVKWERDRIAMVVTGVAVSRKWCQFASIKGAFYRYSEESGREAREFIAEGLAHIQNLDANTAWEFEIKQYDRNPKTGSRYSIDWAEARCLSK